MAKAAGEIERLQVRTGQRRPGPSQLPRRKPRRQIVCKRPMEDRGYKGPQEQFYPAIRLTAFDPRVVSPIIYIIYFTLIFNYQLD